ncbi:MAG TPA: hypothetical protein VGI03_03095 [Verrucomicrobiae bacterium]|jgi:hypothetical protein
MNIGRWSKSALVMLAAFLLAGCASPRIDWTDRMGHYPYDQAVKDFGPPDKYAKLTDGTIVGEWMTQHGRVIVQTEPFYPGPYGLGGPLPPTTYSEQAEPNFYMRLTFAPDGLLEGYKDVMR